MASPNIPDWTFHLWAALQNVTHLTDMGIYPIRRFRLIGRCSWHGRQDMVVESTDILTDDITDGYIPCELCFAGGVKKWLPIVEFLMLPEGKNS